MSIVARLGDLTQSNAHVIVNAGNTSLWLGAGVAGAIRIRGGPSIQEELDRIREGRNQLRRRLNGACCDIGEVIVTHAGNMKARYVFHAAVMDSQGSNKGKTSLDIVRLATLNCMLAMRQYGVYGIAFPIFGTGVGGLDYQEAATTMIDTILDYHIEDALIRLYSYTSEQYEILKETLKSLYPV